MTPGNSRRRYGKGKGGNPRRAAAGKSGSRIGKPRPAGLKGYVGAGHIGKPGEIVRDRQTKRSKDSFIQPQHLGFKLVDKAWVGKVRIKVVPGGSERQRKAARTMRGFSLDVTLSFELRGGFINKRTLLVNGKPSGLGEKRVKHLNAVLGRSILEGDILEMHIRPDIAKALEKTANEEKA